MVQGFFVFNVISMSLMFYLVESFGLRDNSMIWDQILKANDVDLEFEFEPKRRQQRPLARRDVTDSGYNQFLYRRTPVYHDYGRARPILKEEQPVVMKDLQGALDKIDDKLKEFQNHLRSRDNSTTVDVVENEATRPALMKDLWKYFGENADCDDDSEEEADTANMMTPGPSGRLDNIIKLLQKGGGVNPMGTNQPKDNDISWVKLKVKE